MNTICEFPEIKNKKILFLGETHFHVINCINIACHTTDSTCDLFLDTIYEKKSHLYNDVIKIPVFRKIITYSEEYSKVLKTMRILSLRKYISKVFGVFDYDIVFFTVRNFLTRCIVTYCKHYNPMTSLIAYDEGLGAYISLLEDYTNPIEKKIVGIKYHEKNSFTTDKMLYKPEAYVGRLDNIILYRMPVINKDVINIINELYDYNENMKIKEKFIYFDGYYQEEDELKTKVLDCLRTKSKGSFIVKKHPFTPGGLYADVKVYQYSNIPFELIVANDPTIKDKVLITSISTAVWTPMMLFNYNPTVILLYPMFDEMVAKEITNKLSRLNNGGNVYVVKSFSELEFINLQDL